MAWPLVFLAIGGAAFACRGVLRVASKSGVFATRIKAEGAFAPALNNWLNRASTAASTCRRHVQSLTRDLRGFENPMTTAEAYQILRLR